MFLAQIAHRIQRRMKMPARGIWLEIDIGDLETLAERAAQTIPLDFPVRQRTE
jgi:hypothetical protein